MGLLIFLGEKKTWQIGGGISSFKIHGEVEETACLLSLRTFGPYP